ncbi:MAG: hypothetical protein NVS1B10_03220 [Candidatus Saccharimonadales bacterium]
MIYTIGAIIMAIGSLATWIYGLIKANQALKLDNALKDAAAAQKEWQDSINAQAGKVTEDVKDYEKAKQDLNDQLNSNNPK